MLLRLKVRFIISIVPMVTGWKTDRMGEPFCPFFINTMLIKKQAVKRSIKRANICYV